MASQTIVFDNFGAGDAGRRRPRPNDYQPYRGAPLPNDLSFYRGVNTWLYPNGALGPRPPWQYTAITGLPTGKTLRRFNAMTGQAGLWVAYAFCDGTVYSSIAPGISPVALRGTITGPGDPIDSVGNADEALYCTRTVAGARVLSDGTFAVLTAMPAGSQIEVYGEQYVVLQNNVQAPPILRFSDLRDPTTWAAENSAFIGNIGIGSGLYIYRDALIIIRFDGSAWQFTGVLGPDAILRRIDQGLTPAQAGLADGATVSSSVIYYTTGKDMTAFTGAQLVQLSRPDLAPVSGFDMGPQKNNHGWVVPLDDDQRFMVIGTADQVANSTVRVPWAQSYSPDQGWNRHTVPVTPYVFNAADLQNVTSKDSARAVAADGGPEGLVFLVTASSRSVAGSAPKLYTMNSRQEGPYLPAGETLSTAVAGITVKDGDTSLPPVAEVRLGEWWAPEGEEVMVRSLMVDYSYDTDARIASELGAVTPCKFDISVEAMQPWGGSATAESSAQTFIPTGGTLADSSVGTIKRARQVFQVGDQGSGGGFRIHLADLRGIMIHRVVALVDVQPARF